VDYLSPAGLQALHVAAHIDAIERQIVPRLLEGTTVILDRFWWSTKVYGLMDGIPEEHIDALVGSELKFWGPVRPSALFLLERQASLKREIGCSNWSSYVAAYRRLAERERDRYPIHRIKNQAGIDDTVGEVLRILTEPTSVTAGRREPSIHTKPVRPRQGGMLFQGQLPEALTTCKCQRLDRSRWAPAKPTEVFETFWRFAAERQEIFFRKKSGAPSPWSTDSILQTYKFTNAYRASDRVSQYLIKEVIHGGRAEYDEIFFRILLFKIFNRIDTWRLLEAELGKITWADYSFDEYSAVLSRAISSGARIYSAAYIMPAGVKSGTTRRKHVTHLKLIERMMADGVPEKLRKLESMQQAFNLFRSYPGIGDFLAYQYATDVNYSTLTNFSEMEFVVPGPGARDGIRKCFKSLGGLNETELIVEVARRQDEEFAALGLAFRSLWGRPLQLIDCQNLFCEVDKYARIAHPRITGRTGRKTIKQKYREQPERIDYWYPPKWGINERIVSG
jgi:hypothetical protein